MLQKLRHHKTQYDYFSSQARFTVAVAGRRSGKTEISKRRLLSKVLTTQMPNAKYFVSAPTYAQLKKIYWYDLKSMTRPFLRDKSDSELILFLSNGAEIHLISLERAERIEGINWAGGLVDECDDVKNFGSAWKEHIRPALSTPGMVPPWVSFVGTPNGRSFLYKIFTGADEDTQWDKFHWVSADILDPDEIASAKSELDELTYKQEYEASFVSFSGRVYYSFDRETHCKKLEYDPTKELNFCFDFNVSPGVAAVIQEQVGPDNKNFTAIIGEVRIGRDSNTVRVCNKLIEDWGHHKGLVWCYGDATGGARGSAKVLGSDWDLIRNTLSPIFSTRLNYNVPRTNPRERVRINAMNSRLKSSDGTIRLYVDPSKAPYIVKDFEGVTVLPGSAGEIDKNTDKELSHLTDAIGYYCNRVHPVRGITSDEVTVGGL